MAVAGRTKAMPKFLVATSYSAEGAKGLLKEGGSGRRAVAEKLLKSAGGRLESMYFAFGTDDVYLIVDLPDNASAAALSLNISASGAVHARTVPLMTCEEMDMAAKKPVDYRKPGG
jgi:uncharacterized protein with GYD domain